MTKFLAGVVALAIAAIALVGPWASSPRAQELNKALPKWEYKVELMQTDDDAYDEIAGIEKQFNELGEQGWELAELQLRAAIFKRPKR